MLHHGVSSAPARAVVFAWPRNRALRSASHPAIFAPCLQHSRNPTTLLAHEAFADRSLGVVLACLVAALPSSIMARDTPKSLGYTFPDEWKAHRGISPIFHTAFTRDSRYRASFWR